MPSNIVFVTIVKGTNDQVVLLLKVVLLQTYQSSALLLVISVDTHPAISVITTH